MKIYNLVHVFCDYNWTILIFAVLELHMVVNWSALPLIFAVLLLKFNFRCASSPVQIVMWAIAGFCHHALLCRISLVSQMIVKISQFFNFNMIAIHNFGLSKYHIFGRQAGKLWWQTYITVPNAIKISHAVAETLRLMVYKLVAVYHLRLLTRGTSSGQDSAKWPLPSSTRNPGIIPSDDLGEVLSVSSKDIHLSKHAKVSRIHYTLWPQCTNVTDRQTDRPTLTS